MNPQDQEKLQDALADFYEVEIGDLAESNLSEMPLYSSLSMEEWRYENEELIAEGGVKSI